jgi:hypothetical protein
MMQGSESDQMAWNQTWIPLLESLGISLLQDWQFKRTGHVLSTVEGTFVLAQQDTTLDVLPDTVERVPVGPCKGLGGWSALEEAAERVTRDTDTDPHSELGRILGRTDVWVQLLSVRTRHPLEFIQGVVRHHTPRGVYFQYTHSRCCGITRNHTPTPLSTVCWSHVNDERTRSLVRLASEWDRVLEKGGDPSVVLAWLDRMCTLLSSMYYVLRVKGEAERGEARWHVLEYCRKRVESALWVLGVPAVQEM